MRKEQADNMGAAESVLALIRKSPTAFHVVSNICNELRSAGFIRLYEENSWDLTPGEGYYVTRNDSSVISFMMPKEKPSCFRMSASHSDSPCFKVKENPELEGAGACVRLNTEQYGGGILYSFLDRPLKIAGRVLVKEEEKGQLHSVLVDLKDQNVVIPSLAIHFNRDVNGGYAFNLQKDMLPLYACSSGVGKPAHAEKSRKADKADAQTSGTRLLDMIAERIGITGEKILGSDLYVCSADPGCIWGPENEFLSSPRLDDQECVFATFQGFLNAMQGKKRIPQQAVLLHAVFDNEEVGSTTRQGAASTFLRDVLKRIVQKTGMDEEEYQIAIAKSFLISADNAHALHPSHTEKSDPVNAPVLNGGIVLKFNAGQKYTTDGVAAAIVRDLAASAGIPSQDFTNRSDIRGGSTLGSISDTVVPVRTADIGLAQLAMHSAYETAGTKDVEYLVRFMEAYYGD